MTEDEKKLLSKPGEEYSYGEDLLELAAKQDTAEAYGGETPLLKESEGIESLADQDEAKKAVGEEIKAPAQEEPSSEDVSSEEKPSTREGMTEEEKREEFLRNLREDQGLPYWAK